MKYDPDRASTLIIGYGNELRGDDAVGRVAARELARHGFIAVDVHQLTPELAERLSAADRAVFIDSDVSLGPGEVRVVPLKPAVSQVIDHSAGPEFVLKLAREVYGRAPDAWLIGIGPAGYEIGSRLSDAGVRAVGEVVDRLRVGCLESSFL